MPEACLVLLVSIMHCPAHANCRRQGLARKLMDILEEVTEKLHNGYFIDLYVRRSNSNAINMYQKVGQSEANACCPVNVPCAMHHGSQGCKYYVLSLLPDPSACVIHGHAAGLQGRVHRRGC